MNGKEDCTFAVRIRCLLHRQLVRLGRQEIRWTQSVPNLFSRTKARQLLERPFERRIQQVETEIDFGLGRSQRRGYPHDPIGGAGAHDIGTQSEL